MDLNAFLNKIKTSVETIEFNDTIAVIDTNYDFTPTLFKNGNAINEAGKNSGSCKLFAFAKLNNLTPQQTLQCFGAYYRKDVLEHPEATDHQNIRNFMLFGWEGISFEGTALKIK
jgi:HopJ type III effector protein